MGPHAPRAAADRPTLLPLKGSTLTELGTKPKLLPEGLVSIFLILTDNNELHPTLHLTWEVL